mmetsp:Transcript_12237/g.17944  ORF Transcript_12237/g.17944 Transcript_12237/m.17944 type:complete len:126 (-) Transcript_12237:172-549(-)
MYTQPSGKSLSLTKPTELMMWWQEAVELEHYLAAFTPGSRTHTEFININIQIGCAPYCSVHSGHLIQEHGTWINLADWDDTTGRPSSVHYLEFTNLLITINIMILLLLKIGRSQQICLIITVENI